jgi:hypothetical protein
MVQFCFAVVARNVNIFFFHQNSAKRNSSSMIVSICIFLINKSQLGLGNHAKSTLIELFPPDLIGIIFDDDLRINISRFTGCMPDYRRCDDKAGLFFFLFAEVIVRLYFGLIFVVILDYLGNIFIKWATI